MLMKPLRGLYEWTMDKAAHPHAVWWLALFCFMEASFFPVPPHPLLGLMCLAEPKKAIRFGTVATLSSVAGGLLGFCAAVRRAGTGRQHEEGDHRKAGHNDPLPSMSDRSSL